VPASDVPGSAGGIYPTVSLYLLAQISLLTTHMPVVDHHRSNREVRLSITGNLSMMLGVQLTDDEFTQAAAPVPLMGLGLTRAHDVAAISFVTSVHASSGLKAKILQHYYPDSGTFQPRHTAIEKQLIIDLDRTIDDEFLTQALNNHRTASVILSTKVHQIQKEKLLLKNPQGCR
jgi:hypothetical protein